MVCPGTLTVVATPIGNLDDITLRAVACLRVADLIVAEDTRRSRQLLSHLGIGKKPVTCIDAHASETDLRRVLDTLEAGRSVALLTDAGTPSVSDPGTVLVRRCHSAAIPVTALPGPSAVTTAIAASGLVDASFLFLGFLPRKGEKRRACLERIARTQDAVVIFESANRLRPTLSDLARVAPDRLACIARELSKKFEELCIQPLAELAQLEREYRGEITLVLASASAAPDSPALTAEHVDATIREQLAAGSGPKQVATELAELLGLSKRELYQRAVRLRAAD